jgi:RimJ/RimL family protein N-acetyltransferase
MKMVRRIKLGEVEIFRRLRLSSLNESPSAFKTTWESAVNRSFESWCDQADSTAQGSDRATFIAFSGDEPVGIAAIYRDEKRSNVGEILQVWVAPEYRGKGIALDLIDTVFHWAGRNGFREIMATITKGNMRAQRLYQKYGFKLVYGALLEGADDPVLLKKIDVEQGA